jgi:hypothetical protein
LSRSTFSVRFKPRRMNPRKGSCKARAKLDSQGTGISGEFSLDGFAKRLKM